jgi:hypothetical protein
MATRNRKNNSDAFLKIFPLKNIPSQPPTRKECPKAGY